MTSTADLSVALLRLGSHHVDEAAWSTAISFCCTRWEIPAVLTVAYLGMVYCTRNLIPAHSFGRSVDRAFAVWNLGLSLFSCWGVWNMSRPMFQAWRSEGLFFTVCADTKSLMAHGREHPLFLALILFCLSKVPELGDTVFLILKRKPVRLLQWYHHTTVMLFCWLALATEYSPGLWFATTNYFVHSIMYMYFFLMTFKGMARVVKPIAPLITIIQIAQMVWGLVVNGIAVATFFSTGNCQIQAVTVYCAVALYGSYFYLFSQLFVESRKAAKKSGKGVVRAFSRTLSEALVGQEGSDDGAAAAGEKKTN